MQCMTKGDSDDDNKLVGQYSLELEESIMLIDSITRNADLLACINSYIY
jgi:hypothetical protein